MQFGKWILSLPPPDSSTPALFGSRLTKIVFVYTAFLYYRVIIPDSLYNFKYLSKKHDNKIYFFEGNRGKTF